jgi:membrane-associated phospholipid phosphatase
MIDVDRWADDPSRPDGHEVRRDLGRRVLVPALALWVMITAVGLALAGPLAAVGDREESVNEWFVERRTDLLNTLTQAWSQLGNTETVIAICVVVALLVWWRTKQWWYAVVPAVAIAVQAAVFMLSALVVGRPRPDVPHLDDAPPTSSYPSGHTGASTALYVTLALMVQRIERAWLRVPLTVILLLVPLLVVYSRLYRGMHHPTDVAAALVNGLTCVVIGWNWLRRTPAAVDAPVRLDAAESAR